MNETYATRQCVQCGHRGTDVNWFQGTDDMGERWACDIPVRCDQRSAAAWESFSNALG